MLRQPLHQIGDLIAGRYRTQSILGQGSSGITFAVEDIHTRQPYALKALSLRGIQDWKQLELFEREAQVLSQLDHPAIPNYIDYFKTDTDKDRWFYIVQELAPGQSLADLVKEGWRASQAEAREITLQILDILKYLHELSPPIIHRDIKPQNIIRSEDGQIYLVDFGAVQNIDQHTRFGSTVVGTYGYMAPEQFQGTAKPATDLYALGATLLFLLTHCFPADLPQKRLKIDLRSAVRLQPAFADWLEKMLEPTIEDRFTTAQSSIDGLINPVRRKPEGKVLLQQPMGTKVKLHKTKTHLSVDIPPTGLRGSVLVLGFFTLFFDGMTLLATTLSIGGGAPYMISLMPFWLISIVLTGATFLGAAGHTHVEINPQHFKLRYWHIKSLGVCFCFNGHTDDLNGIEITTVNPNADRPFKGCTLFVGKTSHSFGTRLRLSEKAWLVQEIRGFLISHQS